MAVLDGNAGEEGKRLRTNLKAFALVMKANQALRESSKFRNNALLLDTRSGVLTDYVTDFQTGHQRFGPGNAKNPDAVFPDTMALQNRRF